MLAHFASISQHQRTSDLVTQFVDQAVPLVQALLIAVGMIAAIIGILRKVGKTLAASNQITG